jgi:ABC-type transporter Mla maintaining outer membrane lipid asymmetry permease subunit MlaE
MDDKAMQMLTVWGGLLGCSIIALLIALIMGYSGDSAKPHANTVGSQIELQIPAAASIRFA